MISSRGVLCIALPAMRHWSSWELPFTVRCWRPILVCNISVTITNIKLSGGTGEPIHGSWAFPRVLHLPTEPYWRKVQVPRSDLLVLWRTRNTCQVWKSHSGCVGKKISSVGVCSKFYNRRGAVIWPSTSRTLPEGFQALFSMWALRFFPLLGKDSPTSCSCRSSQLLNADLFI